MKRKKRFSIKMVALGFAVVAIAAPAAQAIPEGLTGSEARALQSDDSQLVVSPDDRVIHGTDPQVIKSPDDRPIHGGRLVTPQPVSADDGSGFELSNGAVSGIVLALLAGAMAGFAVLQVRKAGKLANA